MKVVISCSLNCLWSTYLFVKCCCQTKALQKLTFSLFSPCDLFSVPAVLHVFLQVVSPVLQTAAQRWYATVRTSGPPPFPSSPSPYTTSSPLNPHSPSPCFPCSLATSLVCRPAPAPAPALALVLALGVQWGRIVKMQLKMGTGTKGLWVQQHLLLAQFDRHLWGATPRFGSRGRPALEPALPAHPALSHHTAAPALFQQASAQCTPRQQESRVRAQRHCPLPLHLPPWGLREA